MPTTPPSAASSSAERRRNPDAPAANARAASRQIRKRDRRTARPASPRRRERAPPPCPSTAVICRSSTLLAHKSPGTRNNDGYATFTLSGLQDNRHKTRAGLARARPLSQCKSGDQCASTASSRSATMLVILMSGFTAGPAVSLVGIADGVARDRGLMRLGALHVLDPVLIDEAVLEALLRVVPCARRPRSSRWRRTGPW